MFFHLFYLSLSCILMTCECVFGLNVSPQVADDAHLELQGLPLRVFPVWHGGTYVSLGFAFGHRLKGGYPLAGALESQTRCSSCSRV